MFFNSALDNFILNGQKNRYKVLRTSSFTNWLASTLGGGNQRPMSIDTAYNYSEKLNANPYGIRAYAPSDGGVNYNCFIWGNIPTVNLNRDNLKVVFYNNAVNYSQIIIFLYDAAGNYRSWLGTNNSNLLEDSTYRQYGLNIRNIGLDVPYNSQSATPPDFNNIIKMKIYFGVPTGATFTEFILDSVEVHTRQPKHAIVYLDDAENYYTVQDNLINQFYSAFGYYFPFTITPACDAGISPTIQANFLDKKQNKNCWFAPQFVVNGKNQSEFETLAFDQWNLYVGYGLLSGSTYNLSTHQYDNPATVNDNFHCTFDGGTYDTATIGYLTTYGIKTGRPTQRVDDDTDLHRNDFDRRVQKYKLPIVEINKSLPSVDVMGAGGGTLVFYYHNTTQAVIDTFLARWTTLAAAGYTGIHIDDYYRRYLI